MTYHELDLESVLLRLITANDVFVPLRYNAGDALGARSQNILTNKRRQQTPVCVWGRRKYLSWISTVPSRKLFELMLLCLVLVTSTAKWVWSVQKTNTITDNENEMDNMSTQYSPTQFGKRKAHTCHKQTLDNSCTFIFCGNSSIKQHFSHDSVHAWLDSTEPCYSTASSIRDSN